MSRMRLLMLSLSSLAMIVAGASIWQAYASEDVEDNSGKHSLTSSQSLGGLDRYLTHISTDKPLYRPGEQLRVRGVVLHGDSHKPMPASLHVAGLVTIKGPKGDTVAAGYAKRPQQCDGLRMEHSGRTSGRSVHHPYANHERLCAS